MAISTMESGTMTDGKAVVAFSFRTAVSLQVFFKKTELKAKLNTKTGLVITSSVKVQKTKRRRSRAATMKSPVIFRTVGCLSK